MTIELWGTFSVLDHLLERAFVAEVLLYDRLVIPTLPKDTKEDAWPASWDLARQRRALGDLEEVAIGIPWTDDRRAQWQARFDDVIPKVRMRARAEATQFVEQDVKAARDAGADRVHLNVTRSLLQDYVNGDADDALFRSVRATEKLRPGSTLEAVAAYPSYDAFATDVNLVTHPDTVTNPNGHMLNPTSVFGWTFFVPYSAEQGEDEDRRLLAKAVKLARRTDYIELRGEFYKWIADMSAAGIPPAAARADMEKRIAELGKLMKGQEWKAVARRAIKVADAFSGGLGLVNEIAAAGAEAFLGNADIIADDVLRPGEASPRLKVAAVFHESRAMFG